MKALVIGATGATGKPLVQALLLDPTVTEVHIFIRKDTFLSHPKLVRHMVDFDNMQSWQDLIQGDVVFSCLGTTIKSAKTKANQWKIDYQYQYDFARYARQNGSRTLALVSAVGASAKSPFFYTKMKGQLEESIIALNYKTCIIFQPGILLRKDSDRFMEKLSGHLLRFFNTLGLFKKYKPLATEDLALAMLHAAKQATPGLHYYTLHEIEQP